MNIGSDFVWFICTARPEAFPPLCNELQSLCIPQHLDKFRNVLNSLRAASCHLPTGPCPVVACTAAGGTAYVIQVTVSSLS